MNDGKKSERGRPGDILRTEADAEAASERNQSAAREDFMRRADDLFPTDAGPCGCLVLAAGFRRRKDALRTGKVSVWPREDDEGVCLAIQRALELPREVKYPHVALRPDGRVEVEEGWFFPHEARQIAELRAAIHGYCAAAMAFAAKNRYASAELWRALESDLHGRLALSVEETPPSAKETVLRFLDAQRRLHEGGGSGAVRRGACLAVRDVPLQNHAGTDGDPDRGLEEAGGLPPLHPVRGVADRGEDAAASREDVQRRPPGRRTLAEGFPAARQRRRRAVQGRPDLHAAAVDSGDGRVVSGRGEKTRQRPLALLHARGTGAHVRGGRRGVQDRASARSRSGLNGRRMTKNPHKARKLCYNTIVLRILQAGGDVACGWNP